MLILTVICGHHNWVVVGCVSLWNAGMVVCVVTANSQNENEMEATIAKMLQSLKEKTSTLPWKDNKGALRKRTCPYKVPIIGLKMHKRFALLKKL